LRVPPAAASAARHPTGRAEDPEWQVLYRKLGVALCCGDPASALAIMGFVDHCLSPSLVNSDHAPFSRRCQDRLALAPLSLFLQEINSERHGGSRRNPGGSAARPPKEQLNAE
jgi:hypothetical protein